MPKFIHQATTKGFSLIQTPLGWARGKVALFDNAVVRLETVVPQVIGGADDIIDNAFGAVGTKALAVRKGVAARVEPVQSKFSEVQGYLCVQTLTVVDTSERFIDRLLPEPATRAKRADVQDGKHDQDQGQGLVSRIAHLPFRVPVRVTMIMSVSASGAVDTIVLSGKQASNVVWEKQSQFAQHIMERAKPLTDKISAVTSPALDGARSGKDIVLSRLHSGREVMISRFHDGHEFVTVRVNNLVIRLHLVEARDWSVNRLDQVKSSTVSVFMSAVQGVHRTTSRVLGPQRASYWLGTLRLPVDAAESEVEVVSTEDSATATLCTVAAESHFATANLRTVQAEAHSEHSATTTLCTVEVHKRIAESVAVSEVAVRCNSDVTRSDVPVAKLVTDTVHFDGSADELIAG